MFAILLTEANLPKIYETYGGLTDTDKHGLERYTARTRVTWYLIRGFYSEKQAYPVMSILPEYRFVKDYAFDHEKIKTDWTLIVRK